MNEKIIKSPLLEFWTLNTVPNVDIKTTKTPKKIKILFSSTLSDLLKKQGGRLHVNQCEQLMSNIHQQFIKLNKHHMSVAYFDIDDIVIIENKYYFINDKKILTVKTDHLLIKKLYNTEAQFLPYEMGNEQLSIQLPLKIHINSYIYSLALLTLFCLFNKKFNTRSDALIILNQIPGIELYWCLSRCLDIEPNNRKLLFI
jgi:hypothetical protein